MKKKELAVKLSKLEIFKKANVRLEQYPTDSEIAADCLWKAFMQGDIKNKRIADFGCGHGVLGIGALLLGAKKINFVDLDKEALMITKQNIKKVDKAKKFKFALTNSNVKDIKIKTQVVIQNPPFGVKNTHSDKIFLLKAMQTAKTIYSFHKLKTFNFINSFTKDNGFKCLLIATYRFPLKKSMWFHIKKVRYVDVGLWKITKN
ncbi:MAG: METTL5 family protein [Nanoarchaeota archaeon]|nr:METTL5 family protein [Nanoarchaeota archaeon]